MTTNAKKQNRILTAALIILIASLITLIAVTSGANRKAKPPAEEPPVTETYKDKEDESSAPVKSPAKKNDGKAEADDGSAPSFARENNGKPDEEFDERLTPAAEQKSGEDKALPEADRDTAAVPTAAHPEDVSRIYLDAPLMNFTAFNLGGWPAAKVWGSPEGGDWSKDPRMPINLADKIAKAKIPVLLLYGGADTVVPPSKNCEIFIPRFKAAGGDIKVFKRDMYGHHPHGFQGAENVGAIVDFFEGKQVSVK